MPALADGQVVAYATVTRGRVTWTRHVAELRVLVAPAWRGRGLGRVLTAQRFAVAKQRKMIAQMTKSEFVGW